MPKAAELFDGELITEVEAAMWPFRSQIADAEQVRCALALARQRRIAAANHRLQRGFVDGVGEVVASIDADLYHRLGLLYGYETVNSDDFLRCLLRDNPEIRVQTRTRKVGIVLDCRDYKEGSTKDTEGTKREEKEGVASADVCTDAVAVEAGELSTLNSQLSTSGEAAA